MEGWRGRMSKLNKRPVQFIKPESPAKGARRLATGTRLLVMGDIHGQYEKMQKVLELAAYDPAKDRLVLLGDYVDRGPDSKRVVDAVIRLVASGAVALYGNHEDMMAKALGNRHRSRPAAMDMEQWYANGGEKTIAGYRDNSALLDRHLEFFHSLPRWVETQGILFVHAGIRPGVPVPQQAPQDLIWIREPYILGYQGPQDIVAGHTPIQYLRNYELLPGIEDASKPIVNAHKIFVDTGAAWGGPLTVMELPSLVFWQA